MPHACIPPFTTVCVFLFTAAVGVLLALKLAGPAEADAATGRKRHPRFWWWAALYFLFIAVVYAGLLILGIHIDP
jgi:drug/metabolite transporter (DMT)-like permease